jgi:superfamily I DNA/RNA helicase
MTKSSYQLAFDEFIKNIHGGNAVVDAKAGSGKSTTALLGIEFMKGAVIVLAFGKKIATAFQHKLNTMAYPNARSATFHSECNANLCRNRQRPTVNTGKVWRIAELFTQEPELAKVRQSICKIVGYAKNNGIGLTHHGLPAIDDRQSWVNIIQHHDVDLDADVEIEDVIDICIKVLELNNRDVKVIDFDDQIYFPLLFKLKFTKYDWVIVDEAQDTNVIRKLALREMMHENSRLIAIGDPNQAIMGFTGAENDSLNLIKEMFNATELKLSVCYRCGKSIIREAQKYVPDIIAYEGNGEGEVTSTKYDDFFKIAPTLNLNKKDGIVCRNNAPLVSLAFGLIRNGIGCRIEGRDIGQNLEAFTRKWKVNDLATFTLRIQTFFDKAIEKAKKAARGLLEDKYETLLILIERCQSLGKHDVESLRSLIKSMFSNSDDDNVPNVVTLSSIHKSKGLEFDNCYILGMNQFSPSKYATLDWMKEQEQNLMYVAVTRAKYKLTYITDVPTRNKREVETEEQ